MKKLLLGLFCSPFFLFAQSGDVQKGLDAITKQVLRSQVDFLASPWMEGRYSTEKGARLASDYLSSMMGVYGLLPAGDNSTYFQTFNLFRYSHPQNETMEIFDSGVTLRPTANADYYIKDRRVASSFDVSGDLLFVGYGLNLPEYGITNYGNTDVRGKVLILYPFNEKMLNAAPFSKVSLSGADKQRIMDNTAAEAKRRGAAAIIYIMSESEVANTSPHIGKPTCVAEDILALPTDSVDNKPISFVLSRTYLRKAFERSNLNIDKPTNLFSAVAVNLKVKVRLKGDVNGEACQVRNLLGLIPGKDTTQCIIIGGHYDHYGLWDGKLFPGADDNASGTVGVLTLAKAFKESGIKPKVTLIFALWTAEEKGLWGSTYYTRNPYLPMNKTCLYINYDMVGRSAATDSLSRNASVFYYEKDSTLKTVTLQSNSELGNLLSIRTRPTMGGPGGRSDHAPFSLYHVPFIGWMTAFHADYHQPTDTPDKIDYVKMQKVLKVGFVNLVKFQGRL